MLENVFQPCWIAVFAGICAVTAQPCADAASTTAHSSTDIEITVDASSATSRVIHTSMTIPVSSGPLTLFYPKWTVSEHFASGDVNHLSKLVFRADGNVLTWRRDRVDLSAFHLNIPSGASRLQVDFDYFLPTAGTSRANSSARLLMLRWNNVLLYPKGRPIGELRLRAQLKLPVGWKFGTALPVEKVSDTTVIFAPANLDILVDSPVISGLHFRSIGLSANEGGQYYLDIAADSARALAVESETIANLTKLTQQARSLFGVEQFRSYRFLVAASDYTSQGGGLEHRESSDVRVSEEYFLQPAMLRNRYSFLPHELAHAWNGRYRLPTGQVASTFQEPLRNDLLWVYEGLTTYLGIVLGARTGACKMDYCREHLAFVAAACATQTGRVWRPLQDTADATAGLMAAAFSVPTGWGSRHRALDFYNEGALIWLEADIIIRTSTGGKRSLDDFVRSFFGQEEYSPKVKPYTAEEVFSSLEKFASHEWKEFFDDRLTALSATPPLGGLEGSGWRLAFDDNPNLYMLDAAARSENLDVRFSLGVIVGGDGTIVDVIEGSAAGQAGLFPGAKIRTINGREWSPDVMEDAIGRSKSGTPIIVVAEYASFEHTYTLEYREGTRFPHLVRVDGTPDRLSSIFTAIRPL